MTDPTSQIFYSREQVDPDHNRRQLSRAERSGSLIRVARGAYVPNDLWDGSNDRERYLIRIVATLKTRRILPILSHWSAAAYWGLPIIGSWPTQVHLAINTSTGGRSKGDVVKHAARLDDDDVIDLDNGVLLTSLERTVLDMAAATSFMAGVMLADRALLVDRYARRLPLTTREQLEEAWERAQPIRAHAKVRAVLAFAETRAESPLESVSRVTMRTIGVPRPDLQVAHYDAEGFIGDTDFAWPQYRVVGEADGDSKYLDPALRSGKTADQVVLAEKQREDRLRALPRSVARWPWAVGVSPQRLKARLVGAGLPTGQKW